MNNRDLGFRWLAIGLGLLAVCFLLGGFACVLNSKLYLHQQPFYDSLSYNEKLFRVMTIARQDGVLEAIRKACFENATNCLPFVVSAIVAPLVEPTRLIGVWLQSGLLWLFLASVAYYFVRVERFSITLGFLGCSAFLIAKCFYLPNGGLSDFRMDLGLFLGFGLTAAWYLIAMCQPTRGHFVALGLAATLCCLWRATAPVYLVFGLVPLAACQWLSGQKLEPSALRLQRLRLAGLLLSAVIVTLLAGWFYLFNFAHLKYYYVDWNTDANAKLPWLEALRHFEMSYRIMGEPLLFSLVIWTCVTLWFSRGGTMALPALASQNIELKKSELNKSGLSEASLREDAWDVHSSQPNLNSNIIEHSFFRKSDWALVWLALAPVLLMVLRRAGLNPFVCMPTVFGSVMLLALPNLRRMSLLANSRLNRMVVAMVLVAISISFVRAWKRHDASDQDTMAVQRAVIDLMIADAQATGDDAVKFGVAQISDFDTNSLYSTVLFDRSEAQRGLDGVVLEGVKISKWTTFAYPAQADWQRIQGDTDDAKLAALLSDARRNIDFLIVPTAETARQLEITKPYNYINRYLSRIRKDVVNDSQWVRLGDVIKTGNEQLEVYRRQR